MMLYSAGPGGALKSGGVTASTVIVLSSATLGSGIGSGSAVIVLSSVGPGTSDGIELALRLSQGVEGDRQGVWLDEEVELLVAMNCFTS